MFERILVAVDFGSSSLEAAGWVARHLKAELVLAHVVRPLRPPPYLTGSLVDVDAVADAAVTDAEQALESLREQLDVDALTDVRVGDPAVVLEEMAAEHRCDLIVLGEHGQRRFAWPALGRTAFALMARASLPVLFTRALPNGTPRSLLAALGAGPDGVGLIAAARTLQQKWRANASLFHVVDRSFLPDQSHDSPDVDPRSLEQEIRASASEWLGEMRRQARVRGGDVPLEIGLGEPAAELMAALHRGRHDLLLVRGSARPGPGALPDRVSRVLMSAAPCSILRLPGGAAIS